jgi:hypothetical protein
VVIAAAAEMAAPASDTIPDVSATVTTLPIL